MARRETNQISISVFNMCRYVRLIAVFCAYALGNTTASSMESEKCKPQMTPKNQVEEVAADFEYTLPGGANHRMHDLESEYLILFFNTPDCHDCQQVKQYMMTSPVIDSMIIIRELLILAICADPDTTLWKQAKYTHWMINGHDPKQTINQKQLYDLRSIPKLYLLDKNKKTILKNASIETIETRLIKNYE